MSDAHAIARLKGGDIGGLEVLVKDYQVQAVRAAYLVCRDRALAEDIVQSAFLRAYGHIGQFDQTRPFGPWFMKIVVNETLKALRAPHLAPLDAIAVVREEQALVLGTQDLADLEERIEAIETSVAIGEALAQLAPELRAVIVLRYYLGFSDAEISRKLEQPSGTVRWRLHTARQRLRNLLPHWLNPTAASLPVTTSPATSAIEKENPR